MTENDAGKGSDSQSPPAAVRPEQLEHQLELIVSSRVGEDQVAWTIFSIFWAAQVLLVGVLLQGAQFPPHPVAALIVSVLGLAMSTVWGLTQGRSLEHLERFEDLTKRIEDQLVNAGRLLGDHQLTMSPRFRGPRARTVMRASCWGAALLWLISALMFAWCACRCGESCR